MNNIRKILNKNDLDNLHKEKNKDVNNINKDLNELIIKIENKFNDLIKKGTIKAKEMNYIDVYLEIKENLGSQIMEMQDKRDKMEKEYEIQIKNGKKEYKKMEAKYLEYYNQSIELQKNIDYLQNSFVQGTVKLNTELSELKSKVFEWEKSNRKLEEKYNDLLKDYEKAGERWFWYKINRRKIYNFIKYVKYGKKWFNTPK